MTFWKRLFGVRKPQKSSNSETDSPRSHVLSQSIPPSVPSRLSESETKRLGQELFSSDSEIGEAAAESLCKLGKFELLASALGNESYSGSKDIEALLGRVGDKRALEPLIARLGRSYRGKDLGDSGPDRWTTWRSAARALGVLGDQCAIQPLLGVLDFDYDSSVPEAACSALAALDSTDGLVQASTHNRWEVRCAAAEGLAKLGGQRAVEVLIKMSESDKEEAVRNTVTVLLYRMGASREEPKPAQIRARQARLNRALQGASQDSDLDWMREVLSQGADPGYDDGDMTLLQAAAMCGRSDVMRILIEHHAPVEMTSQRSYRKPLHLAAAHGQAGAVKILLEAGAYINIGDENRSTALMWAASRGYEDVIRVLLSFDADKNMKNRDGQTAFDVAKGNKRLQRLLRTSP